MKKIFDTHCHLNIEPYINDLNQYLNNMDLNTMCVNIVGTDYNDSLKAIEITNLNENIYATIGIHPNNVEQHELSIINKLEALYLNNRNKIIGIGETGLDYHYDNYNKKLQLEFLEKHYQLALKYNLVLVLHIRDAHSDAISFLKSKKILPNTIIHCFSGDINDMHEYIKLGCYISISGIVTFKNATNLQNIVPLIPNELLLSETDAPFLTPVPYRGKTNLPQYVIHVNEKIAELKNMDINLINELIYKNAIKCFRLKK